MKNLVIILFTFLFILTSCTVITITDEEKIETTDSRCGEFISIQYDYDMEDPFKKMPSKKIVIPIYCNQGIKIDNDSFKIISNKKAKDKYNIFEIKKNIIQDGSGNFSSIKILHLTPNK